MASRLATTIFQGNGNDAMLVEDAYKVSTNETRNSVFDTVKGVYGDAVQGMKANKSSITQLANLVAQAKAGTVSKADMLERALGAMGSSLPNLLGTLGGTLKNKITDATGLLIGDGASKDVAVLYNNAQLLLKVANVKDLQDMTTFLTELTGQSDLLKIINIEAEGAIFGGILNQLSEYNIPGLFDDVIGQISTEAAKKKALQYYSSTSVNGSDLKTINKIIDTIGLTAFLEANPDAVRQLLSNFFFGTLDTVETYPAKRAELIATLVRINAQWDNTLRNGTYIKNLSPYSTASTDAKVLFALSEPERTLSLASATYAPKAVNAVIKDLYPNAYVS